MTIDDDGFFGRLELSRSTGNVSNLYTLPRLDLRLAAYSKKCELFQLFMNKSATRIDYLIKEIRSLKDHYGESIEDLKADFVIK